MLAGIGALSLVLGGCASPPIAGAGGDADYQHPRTGQIQHCDNHTTAGLLLFGVIGAVVSGNNYADCKSDLEAKGYIRIRGPIPALATPAPNVLPPPTDGAQQTDALAPPPPRQVEVSQVWILGKWQTIEGISGGVDGAGQFQFQQVGAEIKWKMARSGWISGVQTTQTASGSVRKLTESVVELVGKYESSNLGNVEGHALKHSFVRDGLVLSGYEMADDSTQSRLSLKKLP